MSAIERRAIALGITEEAVDALVRDQSRPLVERVCDFAEGVIASQRAGAVDDRDALQAALSDVINHYVLSDEPEAVVIDRAVELLDRIDEQ